MIPAIKRVMTIVIVVERKKATNIDRIKVEQGFVMEEYCPCASVSD
jgi:hypothetical protein